MNQDKEPPTEETSEEALGQSSEAEASSSAQGAPEPVSSEQAQDPGDGPDEATASAPDAASTGSDLAADSALDDLVGVNLITKQLEVFEGWVSGQMLTLDLAIQAAILIGAIAPAAIFAPRLKRFTERQLMSRAPAGVIQRAVRAAGVIAPAIALRIILQIALVAMRAAGFSTGLLEAGASLLTAWIAVRMVTLVIRSAFWSSAAFYIAWPIAALDAFGFLDDVVAQLEQFSAPIGETAEGETLRFSALDLIRTVVIFGVLFWVANVLKAFVKGRLDAIDELTVSFKTLLGKILDILMPSIALLVALQIVGFPFGALAIFGGAVGLGIGLGMQRTVANFIAGFTLIADKSIKPGDTIEVGDTYGWVTKMNGRYVSVRTRDGTAHLVPNEIFINEGVTNWSHSDRVVRLHAPFGVSYETKDLRGLAKAVEETAQTVDRVIAEPSPRCNLMAFGDSSIDFDLRFWIQDPESGVNNVRSDVMMAIWDLLHEKGIEIPFPQRDLHIKSAPVELAPRAPSMRGERDMSPVGPTLTSTQATSSK